MYCLSQNSTVCTHTQNHLIHQESLEYRPNKMLLYEMHIHAKFKRAKIQLHFIQKRHLFVTPCILSSSGVQKLEICWKLIYILNPLKKIYWHYKISHYQWKALTSPTSLWMTKLTFAGHWWNRKCKLHTSFPHVNFRNS